MATLTETAYKARIAIRYGAMGFVGITVLWFAGVAFVNFWQMTHPTPPPPPKADFGPVPGIIFPKSNLPKLTYSLQTPTGQLGEFPDRMNVFFAPNRKSSFSAADQAIDIARRLGFLTDPNKLSASNYRWTNSDPLPGTLEMDVVSQQFELKKQWQADPSLLTAKRYLNDRQAVSDASAFLRGVGLLPDDMVGQEKVSYYRVSGDKLVPAISLSDAEFVRVDFFRSVYNIIDENKKILASYDFFTPIPKTGLISMLLSESSDEKRRVIEISNHFIDIDYTSLGEYPVKTAEQAFEELKNGQGFVASFKSSANAVIRRVNLGYYDGGSTQSYEMPVYIFTGDNDLVAYVSAVRSDQIQGGQ